MCPRTEREHLVTFHLEPVPDAYLSAVAACTQELSGHAQAIVLSLGYDTVAEDPHGSWSFAPGIFLEVGRLLAATGLPVCVIQEGGYLLDTLAECSHAFATGLLEQGTP
jgi:acetoin utilization deacetylase AcuC-like enzyme